MCVCMFLACWLGITNTIGRIIAGFFADNKRFNTLLMHNAALIAAGVTCFANMFCTTYVSMYIFAAVFGLCIGWSAHIFYSIVERSRPQRVKARTSWLHGSTRSVISKTATTQLIIRLTCITCNVWFLALLRTCSVIGDVSKTNEKSLISLTYICIVLPRDRIPFVEQSSRCDANERLKYCVSATWITLTSIVLCDLLGLERLTNAFGLLCMSRGIAAMVGSPIAGMTVHCRPYVNISDCLNDNVVLGTRQFPWRTPRRWS